MTVPKNPTQSQTMKLITETESEAVASLLTEVLSSFTLQPNLAGEPLVRSMGKERRRFDPAALTAYIKLSKASRSK